MGTENGIITDGCSVAWKIITDGSITNSVKVRSFKWISNNGYILNAANEFSATNHAVLLEDDGAQMT
jgi:hypothetical protein